MLRSHVARRGIRGHIPVTAATENSPRKLTGTIAAYWGGEWRATETHMEKRTEEIESHSHKLPSLVLRGDQPSVEHFLSPGEPQFSGGLLNEGKLKGSSQGICRNVYMLMEWARGGTVWGGMQNALGTGSHWVCQLHLRRKGCLGLQATATLYESPGVGNSQRPQRHPSWPGLRALQLL